MERIAMIGGASGGVAQALAPLLRSEGFRLAQVGREASRIVAGDGDLLVEADLSTPDGAARAMQAVEAALGTAPDAFVNCAGSTLIASIARTREEQYRDCLRANLDTAFFGVQAWLDALKRAGKPGAAVLFSSVVAGVGVANHAAIAAAKGAVESLVRSVAADVSALGIRINAIAPGLMRTPMTARMVANEAGARQVAAQYPLGRHGEAEDAARLAAFLVSEHAGWITGQVIGLDGGFRAVRPLVRAAG
jgi:NAD(P)-dependent dehydrogenase (short-subunit alcohol dehydrogenase family)